MERSANLFDVETISQTTKLSSRRSGKSKPRSKAGAALRAEFESFAAALREELGPEGILQSIYAERAIVAAWLLREAVEAERAVVLECLGADSIDLFGRLADDLRRQTDRAERSLARTLESLNQLRTADRPAWGQAAELDTTVRPVEDEVVSDQFPTFPTTIDDEAGEDQAPQPRWQDRLVFDKYVSDASPVVKGTWITVAQIVSLIVDGQTWADILRSHPELTEDDIRTCLSYATEQESSGSCGTYLA
jgi:uncharacterized protein (DUF433 family)